MPSPKTLTSTVPFQTPNGTPIANGYVIFDLSQPATLIGTGGQVAPTRVTVNLDANGNVAANQSIYANDQLSPLGTLYLIRIESNTNLLLSPTPYPSQLLWNLQGASPIDLAQVQPVSGSSGVSLPGVVLLAPAAEQSVTGFPLSLIALDLPEAAKPAAPAASTIRLYSKAGDGLFYENSAGTETGPLGQTGVTSVALTMPAEFSVGGSPITTSGTLAVTKATETANTVWAGPTSGGALAPTFRALVSADIPNNAANTTGKSAATDALNSATTVVNVVAATAPTSGQVLTATSSTAATWQNPAGGAGYKVENVNSTPVTVTNSASEAVLMSFTLPANELGNNQVLRIHASGTITTAATQTLTMRVRAGGLAGTQLGASDVAIGNSSGGSWNLTFNIIANGAPSASTATECQGSFQWNNGTTTPFGTTMSNSATVSWATNSSQAIVITQSWSAAVTATVTQRQMVIERLN